MYKDLVNDLVNILNKDGYLNVVLDESLKRLNLNDSDRKLYTKIIYGVVEKKLLLDFYLSKFTHGKRVKPLLKNTLRVGAYVIDYLNVANHYIVNELVGMMKKEDFKAAGFVNAVLRSYERTPKDDLSKFNKYERMALELSLPLDLTMLLYKQYGDQIVEFFSERKSFNTYRINLIKTSKEEVYKCLDENNYIYDKEEDAIICGESLLKTDLFKDGKIIAQDYASMCVAHVLAPSAGICVLDVSAAPGGKSLHIASLLNNNCEITACDIYPNKLDKIKDNAKRLGVNCINTIVADATNYDYGKLYDVVVCDVPCSGLGTIIHKPDLKYRMSIKDINDIVLLQEQILNNAKKYVKPGGILMYSTCTINKNENEYQVKKFIKENNEFKKIDERIILPNEMSDGFYICKLRKE